MLNYIIYKNNINQQYIKKILIIFYHILTSVNFPLFNIPLLVNKGCIYQAKHVFYPFYIVVNLIYTPIFLITLGFL